MGLIPQQQAPCSLPQTQRHQLSLTPPEQAQSCPTPCRTFVPVLSRLTPQEQALPQVLKILTLQGQDPWFGRGVSSWVGALMTLPSTLMPTLTLS